jgi:hypothetical protein
VAAYSAVSVKSATLSTTVVDTVTLTGGCTVVEVMCRHATQAISFTVGQSGGAATPTALGDNCYVVLAGQRREVAVPGSRAGSSDVEVKIIGSGDPYTVTAVR